MKRRLMLLVCLFVMAGFSVASADTRQRLITTRGSAEIKAQNDSAVVRIAVRTEGQLLEATARQNARKAETLVAALKGLKVQGLTLKTTGYRVTPQRDYQAKPPKTRGYEVYNAVEALLEKQDPKALSERVSKIIGTALEKGANQVDHIRFYVKDPAPYEKQALTGAVREAADRAEILARAAGVAIKRVVTITTEPLSVAMPMQPRAALMRSEAAGMAPPVESGDSTISIEVTMVHEME